ncbi:MAG: energy-coupling factor transporter transmembrane component T family protein [Gammaproteobacteria bacterium]
MSHEHRADGRLRVAAALLVSFAAALIRSIDTLTILLVVALIATAVLTLRNKVNATSLAKRLAVVNVFVLWIWLTIPIDWVTLRLSETGIALALQISLRINVIALAVSGLLTGMSGIDFARSFVALGLPQSLGTLLALSVRSIALLESTRNRLDRAMRARGYRATMSLRTVRVNAQLVAWLIVHALVRSERIRLGLAARGYTDTRWPSRQHSHWHSLPLRDWALLLGVSVTLVVATVLPNIWN